MHKSSVYNAGKCFRQCTFTIRKFEHGRKYSPHMLTGTKHTVIPDLSSFCFSAKYEGRNKMGEEQRWFEA